MTDITPNPTAAAPEVQQFLSPEMVLDVERKLRENKAAELKGEPPPHQVTAEDINRALMAIKHQRGTLDFASKAGAGAGKKGVTKIELDIDGL
jgi:hypothetical protein